MSLDQAQKVADVSRDWPDERRPGRVSYLFSPAFPGDATSGFSSEMRISFKAEKPGVVTQVSRVSLILHILSFS
jgi:hypothetical protein